MKIIIRCHEAGISEFDFFAKGQFMEVTSGRQNKVANDRGSTHEFKTVVIS